MIQFQRKFREKILTGQKTETRQMWAKVKVKPGVVYVAKDEGWMRPGFAKIRVLAVFREPLAMVDGEAAKREGFASVDEFLEEFLRLNSKKVGGAKSLLDVNLEKLLSVEPFVVRFEVVERMESVRKLALSMATA